MRCCLTIAGSDSGGNAGVQADLRAFHAYGLHGCTVFTALTAQNPFGVSAIHQVPADFVAAQLDAVLGTYDIAAAKTGMLGDVEVIKVVAEKLKAHPEIKLVVDPVMIATSGAKLVSDEAIAAAKKYLFPLATILTPNLPEADALGDLSEFNCAVLVKGGHAEGGEAVDVLKLPTEPPSKLAFALPWVKDPVSTHGTGCTLAASLAAELALGADLPTAVAGAKKTVHKAIAKSYYVGKDCGVLGFPNGELKEEPLVSIVIACPERGAYLAECLAAIERQTYRRYEVIVVDDELSGKVRPAEKRNLGIKLAKGELVAFIDDDAYPAPEWLEEAVKAFEDAKVGAVGGPAVTPPNDSYLARISGRIYDNPLVSGNFRYRYKADNVRREIEDYPSCNLIVRKEVLTAIKGYRTDFWPGEDTLLCKDIVDRGEKIVYEPKAIVYHHRRPVFGAHLRQLARYAFHRGYFVKRYPSNSLKVAYFIPTAFTLGFLALPYLWPLYALYAILVLVTTFAVNPKTWMLTAIGVLSTHLTYGVKFVQGLCAKKAPCEFIGKDHN